MIYNDFAGFFQGSLRDSRNEKRAEKVMNDMLTFGNVVVNKFCSTNTKKIGAYRMFGNNNLNYEDLTQGVIQSCKDNQEVDHLLCIQDTTELNFTHHLERIGKDDKDIGPVTRDDNAGFYCHPMLVVDPTNKIPIGISSIHLWNRKWDKKSKYERNYKKQEISEKESYRWIDSALRTKELLSETSVLTIIGDRESDIYEEIATVPDARTHLLFRASRNRNLYASNLKLYELLASSEEKSIYELAIEGNKKRKNRIAKMSLRFIKVKLQRPIKGGLDKYPDFVEMWAIQASELPESVPDGEDPIIWRLLTSHNVEGVKDAMKYIEWYKTRWLIEELFRIMKSKGLQIESSQLETGAALKKLTVMALQVALTTMTLKLSMKNPANINAQVSFTTEQLQFITVLMNTIEGKTKKQKNPYPAQTLAWVAWGIARLSGWSGYASQGPPGYISLKTGLNIFWNKFEGFKLAINMRGAGDVYRE
jgi:hypothetical protein